MSLVWKLLRQHISIPQLLGFFLANLFGMFIVMLGYQFYCDVVPAFSSEDSFMSSDYLIVSKKLGMANTISGRSGIFTNTDIEDLESQPFVKGVGKFVRAEYQLQATMGVDGQSLINTELFFESVPDRFVDVPLKEWKYEPGRREVPIILPRSYVNMYNFGYAQSHHLPKISESVLGMVDVRILIHGNGKRDEFRGKVIGFSSRLNTILVPQAFMEWSNGEYAPGEQSDASRLIMEVTSPADERISQYVEDHGFEIEDEKLQAEKTMYFLKLVVGLVMIIGLIISALSFYILMLSVYLLLQKNAEKLENLLLIGYSTTRTARPYQLLTIGLNLLVFILALVLLWFVRGYYIDVIESVFPTIGSSSILPALSVGLILFVVVSIINLFVIWKKIMGIWKRKE